MSRGKHKPKSTDPPYMGLDYYESHDYPGHPPPKLEEPCIPQSPESNPFTFTDIADARKDSLRLNNLISNDFEVE